MALTDLELEAMAGSGTDATADTNTKADDTEASLGIEEYFSPASVGGFSAVVKARYSDFLVHEIGLDGTVARLTSLEVPRSTAAVPEDAAAPAADRTTASDGKPAPPSGEPTAEVAATTTTTAATAKDDGGEAQPPAASSNEGGTTTTEAAAVAMETTNEESAETKNANQDATEQQQQQQQGTTTKTIVPFDELESQLSKLIDNPETAKKVMLMLQSHENNSSRSSSSSSSSNDDKAKDADNNKEDEKSDGKPTTTTTPPAEEAVEKTTTVEKFVTLPALEKPQRKAVHEWVRNALVSIGRADTLDGKIRIWHSRFEKEMPNYKAFGTHKRRRKLSDKALRKKARAEWPPDRPDFLRFVLYKENCDTTTATRELLRRGSTNRIGTAGMKDKRGITSQFCTMYRTLPEQVVNAVTGGAGPNHRNQKHRRGGGGGNTQQKGYSIVKTGNFEYVSEELRLGSLKGNRFDVILRNVRLLGDENNDDDDGFARRRKAVLEKAAGSMKTGGFINYFGTQRFGKFRNTHLVGIAVLKGDFEKAIDTLMAPNDEDRKDIAQARRDWKDRFTYGKTKENESATAKRVLKRYVPPQKPKPKTETH